MRPFETLQEMIVWAAQDVRPVRQMTVPEAAETIPRMLHNRGSYVGPWRNAKTPYLVEPAECLTDPDLKGTVFVGPAQCGKALPLDTPIATPTGWTTMGELRVGDKLFSKDGSVTVVEAVSPIMLNHECLRVDFDDGSSQIADAEHLWEVYRKVKPGYNRHEVRTTASMHGKELVGVNARSRFFVDVAEALDLPESALPIDPYIMGLWLGDGDRRSGYIACGRDDLDEVCALVRSVGYHADPYTKSNCPTIKIRTPSGDTLRSVLKTMGLIGPDAVKRVPAAYLRASKEQRRRVLCGIMDSDGWTSSKSNKCVFSTVESTLSDGLHEILVSLGYRFGTSRVSGSEYNYAGETRRGSDVFKTCFTPDHCEDVFCLERKAFRGRAKPLRLGDVKRRAIRRISSVPSVPVRCIRVAHPSGLFLAGRNMIPTHNTDALLLNYAFQNFVTDPKDMMLVLPTQAAGRDFSERRVKRLIRHNPALNEKVLSGRQNQNVFDIKFSSGTMLTISWPSISELSGKPIPVVCLTDYDRMPENVEGEGAPFDLATTRTRTFGRSAMTLAESSPSFITEDPEWVRTSEHEAPPTKGILALYNRGDRRRYYWRCFVCDTPFIPKFDLLVYPDTTDPMEAGAAARMKCPHCQAAYDHDGVDSPGKSEMNLRRAKWVPDGGRWLDNGSIMRTLPASDIASFWFMGVCAEFSSWSELVAKYVRADQEYQRTGSEEAMKTTVNVDQGDVFTPVAMKSDRSPTTLQGRAVQLDRGVVPEGARFLISTIDVQKGRFVVQVHAFGVGGERWIIDRFDIRESEREPEVENGPRPRVRPPAFSEDWHLIIPQVIEKTYPLEGDPDRVMRVLHTACDSGGEEGVTAKAYEFWRSLRDDEKDRRYHTKFSLVKGGSTKDLPRVQRTFPDSERKDRRAAARGEVPVLLLNPITVKDMSAALLDRDKPGGDRLVPSYWFPEWLYRELTAEVRTSKGWENPKKARNEGFDLLTYAVAIALAHPVNIEHLDWASPPAWAAEWDKNPLIVSANQSSLPPEAPSLPSAKKLASKLL